MDFCLIPLHNISIDGHIPTDSEYHAYNTKQILVKSYTLLMHLEQKAIIQL